MLSRRSLGICLEEYEYPYPVHFFSLTTDPQPLKMAPLASYAKLPDVARLGDFLDLSLAASRDIPHRFLTAFMPFLAT